MKRIHDDDQVETVNFGKTRESPCDNCEVVVLGIVETRGINDLELHLERARDLDHTEFEVVITG